MKSCRVRKQGSRVYILVTQIPNNKAMPFVKKIAKLVVRKRKDQPKLSPRKPVVNGKINNSAGWIKSNKPIVIKYANTPNGKK